MKIVGPVFFKKDGETLDGLLLHHAHRQWGLADAVVLDVLASEADVVSPRKARPWDMLARA